MNSTGARTSIVQQRPKKGKLITFRVEPGIYKYHDFETDTDWVIRKTSAFWECYRVNHLAYAALANDSYYHEYIDPDYGYTKKSCLLSLDYYLAHREELLYDVHKTPEDME